MKINIDPPSSETRRERVEHAVFNELARHRAQDLVAEREPERRSWWRPAALVTGAMGVALAALTIVVLLRREVPQAALPTQIVTRAGGAAHLTLEDIEVEAGSNTLVDVQSGPGGERTLVLTHGSVDCEVAPRRGRAPFKVRAGKVTVEVIGTAFLVEREDEEVRVTVRHGTVRVSDARGTQLVTAGQAWTSSPTAAVAPKAEDEPEIEIHPDQPPATGHRPESRAKVGAKELYEAAQGLEARDPGAAAASYREAALAGGAWGALSLYALAQLEVGRGHAGLALRALEDYERRFPSGANAEDVAWLRVDLLRAAGRTEAMRAAARRYLERFPGGTYGNAARRLSGE
jgi:hypothetical protein